MAEDKSLTQLQEENLRIQNEHLKQQTEFYAQQNEEFRAKKGSRERNHTAQEETLEAGRRADRNIQRGCTHRKGGKGDDLQKNHGGDPNYSIVPHLYALGAIHVLCTRCFAEWKPGDTAKSHPTGIAYETALNWPTDNSPSGAAQFRIPEPPVRTGPIERR